MSKSTILYKRIWYLPTFLEDKRNGKCTLIFHRYNIRKTLLKGNILLGNQLDAKEFDSQKEMAEFIKGERALELPLQANGNPRFVPEQVLKLKRKYMTEAKS